MCATLASRARPVTAVRRVLSRYRVFSMKAEAQRGDGAVQQVVEGLVHLPGEAPDQQVGQQLHHLLHQADGHHRIHQVVPQVAGERHAGGSRSQAVIGNTSRVLPQAITNVSSSAWIRSRSNTSSQVR